MGARARSKKNLCPKRWRERDLWELLDDIKTGQITDMHKVGVILVCVERDRRLVADTLRKEIDAARDAFFRSRD
jgi:hypothetical protein